ncbi:MAG: DNA polymerase [Oscillospiraceae bacterium]
MDGLLKVIGPDGRIHSSFNQTETRTGPHLLHRAQPAEHPRPARSWAGNCARFSVAPEGWVLVDADYSQIELRVLAHMAGMTHDDRGLQHRTWISTASPPPRCSGCRRSWSPR